MEIAVSPVLDAMHYRPARGAIRYTLRLPVTLLADGEWHDALTENISSSGVLFQLKTPLRVGQEVEFLVEIPVGVLNLDHTAAIQCRGSIVRNFWKDGTPWAAAVIDDYEFQ